MSLRLKRLSGYELAERYGRVNREALYSYSSMDAETPLPLAPGGSSTPDIPCSLTKLFIQYQLRHKLDINEAFAWITVEPENNELITFSQAWFLIAELVHLSSGRVYRTTEDQDFDPLFELFWTRVKEITTSFEYNILRHCDAFARNGSWTSCLDGDIVRSLSYSSRRKHSVRLITSASSNRVVVKLTPSSIIQYNNQIKLLSTVMIKKEVFFKHCLPLLFEVFYSFTTPGSQNFFNLKKLIPKEAIVLYVSPDALNPQTSLFGSWREFSNYKTNYPWTVINRLYGNFGEVRVIDNPTQVQEALNLGSLNITGLDMYKHIFPSVDWEKFEQAGLSEKARILQEAVFYKVMGHHADLNSVVGLRPYTKEDIEALVKADYIYEHTSSEPVLEEEQISAEERERINADLQAMGMLAENVEPSEVQPIPLEETSHPASRLFTAAVPNTSRFSEVERQYTASVDPAFSPDVEYSVLVNSENQMTVDAPSVEEAVQFLAEQRQEQLTSEGTAVPPSPSPEQQLAEQIFSPTSSESSAS